MSEKWKKYLRKGRIAMGVVLVLLAICGTWNWRNAAMFFESLGDAGSINLYGQVVDETGLPLAGATVNFKISKPNPFLIVGYERSGIGTKESVVTDANGRFSITGRWGRLLTIYRIDGAQYREDMSKRQSPEHPSEMKSNPVGASATNPAIFKVQRIKR